MLSAQTYTGGLRGAVSDAQGIVPGAIVTLINDQTSAKRATTSNDAGEYTFANVMPGSYTLRVEMSGFAAFENRAVRVGTQEFLVIDVALKPSGVSEQVFVTATPRVLETGTASVSSLIDRQTLETAPTPGRNPFFLAVTTPNVVPSGDPQFVRQQDQTNASLLSLAGGPRRGNNYTLEGVAITDIRNRAVIVPSIEAVEEVKVQVSTFDAEMGRTGGGVFNTIGRSGSNVFHGSALTQNRPQWGMGEFFFAKRQNLPKPDGHFWLYGGSAGGPIVQNRTFFFASTEGYNTLTSRNTVLTLPTALERQGDFSQSGITIYDPLTTRPDPNNPGLFIRDPFPGNRIPAERLNPVARNLIANLPLPTSGKTMPALAGLNDKANQFTGKVDHRWSDALQTSGMYAWYDSQEPSDRFYGGGLGENPADPGDGALYRTVHVLTLNNTWVGNGGTVAALRYGFTSFRDDDVPVDFDPSSLGFSSNFLNAIPYAKFPAISVEGYGRTGTRLLGDRALTDITYFSHGANGSVSRLMGRHTLKAGADYRLIGVDFYAYGQSSGSFSFTRGFTQGPNPNVSSTTAGDAFASFLLGNPSSGDITVGTPNSFYVHYMAGYAQDDFRVTNALTVTAGLRYEYETGLAEKDNRMTVGFDRDARVSGAGARHEPARRADVRGRRRLSVVSGRSVRQPVRAARRRHLVAQREDRAARRLRIVLGADAVSGSGRDVVRDARVHGDHDVFRERGWRTDAGGHADQSVPERHRAAAGQRRRPGDRRGRRRPLRRSVRQAGLRAAVLDRSAARAARPHRGLGRLRRQPIGSAVGGRHGGRDGEHQSDSDRIPVARIGAAADGGESVLRQRGVRRAEPVGDDRARAAAASVSAVRQHLRASRDGSEGALSLDGAEGGEAHRGRLGRARQLHLEPDERQSVRRDELLRESRRAARQLRPRS